MEGFPSPGGIGWTEERLPAVLFVFKRDRLPSSARRDLVGSSEIFESSSELDSDVEDELSELVSESELDVDELELELELYLDDDDDGGWTDAGALPTKSATSLGNSITNSSSLRMHVLFHHLLLLLKGSSLVNFETPCFLLLLRIGLWVLVLHL